MVYLSDSTHPEVNIFLTLRGKKKDVIFLFRKVKLFIAGCRISSHG